MRAFFALAVAPLLLVGCTPGIPTDDSFSTSALAPIGPVPPEFADFNSYNPGGNAELQYQMCATSYQPLDRKMLAASPGQLDYTDGRCRTHIPLIGDLIELPTLPRLP